MQSPFVSVITPVHNGEPYITECIESVLAQTYQNWEYIIVNNCSTDRTLEIAREYARQDSRIRIHNNRALVKMAPNHDIAVSLMSPDSEHCKLVHADDFLFPECLERMVAVMVEHPSVGIVGSYRLDDKVVNLDGLPYPSTVVSGRDICRKYLLEDLFVFGSPTSLLIRSHLLRNRKEFMDDETFFMHGDTAACHEMLMSVDFGFVHQVLTFTRREDSATDTPRAVRLNSYIAARCMILSRFGRFYLDESEYAERMKTRLAEYYSFLACSLTDDRDLEFWRFHRQALDAIGYPLDRSRLMRTALAEEKMDHLRHPVKTVSGFAKSFGRLRQIDREAGGGASGGPAAPTRQPAPSGVRESA